jgi:hypothetical protein
VAEDGAEVGFGSQVKLIGDCVGATSAQPDLGGRLLTGHIERGMPISCPARCDLEQQGGLTHARLPSEQHHHSWHQTIAKHAVKLGDAGARMTRERGTDVADRDRLADRHGWGDLAQLWGRGLDNTAPRLTLAAAADPATRPPAAFGTRMAGPGVRLRHGREARAKV